MQEKSGVVIFATHAGEDVERATFPFVMGNAALATDEPATVVLQGAGVYLGKKGYTDHIHAPAFDPLTKLVQTFVELGGRIFVCAPCIKERNIVESDLIEGAQIVAGAGVISACCEANAVFSY